MGKQFSCWSPDRTHGVKKKDGVGAGDGLFMHGRRRQGACWVWASACMTRKPCRLAPRQTRHGPGGNSVGLGLRPLKVLQKVGWAYNGPEIRGNWANGKKTAQWALDPQNINYKWNKNNDEQIIKTTNVIIKIRMICSTNNI